MNLRRIHKYGMTTNKRNRQENGINVTNQFFAAIVHHESSSIYPPVKESKREIVPILKYLRQQK